MSELNDKLEDLEALAPDEIVGGMAKPDIHVERVDPDVVADPPAGEGRRPINTPQVQTRNLDKIRDVIEPDRP